MRNLRFLIVPCISALWSFDVYAQAVEPLTLSIREMFDLAEANNSRIRAYTVAVEEAEEGIRVAKSAYLPSVEASLSFSYNGDGTILDRDFGNPFKAEIPAFGNNFALEASQVILPEELSETE